MKKQSINIFINISLFLTFFINVHYSVNTLASTLTSNEIIPSDSTKQFNDSNNKSVFGFVANTLFSSNTSGTSFGFNFFFSRNKNIFSIGTIIGHPLSFYKYWGIDEEYTVGEKYIVKGLNFNIQHDLYFYRKFKFSISYDLIYIFYQQSGQEIFYQGVASGWPPVVTFPTVDYNCKRHVFENVISYNINFRVSKNIHLGQQSGIGISTLFNKQLYSNNTTPIEYDDIKYTDWFNLTMLIKFNLIYNFNRD